MTKKQQKNKRKRERLKRKTIFAEKLEAKLPRSEAWFRELYKPYFSSFDEYNKVFAGFIPDVINKHYKYIIEIDGSIHNLEHIKAKDKKKENRYKTCGYKVIRIAAHDELSFKKAMDRVCKIRGKHYKPAKIYIKEEIANLQNTISETVKNADNGMSATKSSP